MGCGRSERHAVRIKNVRANLCHETREACQFVANHYTFRLLFLWGMFGKEPHPVEIA
jgi:hypothetical protein